MDGECTGRLFLFPLLGVKRRERGKETIYIC